MSLNVIVRQLLDYQMKLPIPEPLSNNPPANDLVMDIENHPHAFVIGCVMDRQIPFERAWAIPLEFKQRCGTFEFDAVSAMSLQRVADHFKYPTPLHRYTDIMAKCFHSAINRIADRYVGNAALLWNDRPSSATAVCWFLGFEGVGPKIATMAVNLLSRHFNVGFQDRMSIDISADVHVRRVMSRLGFLESNATIEQVIYTARALNPEYPGAIDRPLWEIGRTWCHKTNPKCNACVMRSECEYVTINGKTK